jgi:hypothetical protein
MTWSLCEAPAHYPGKDGLDAGTTLRCWILPGASNCGFDPCGNLQKLEDL